MEYDESQEEDNGKREVQQRTVCDLEGATDCLETDGGQEGRGSGAAVLPESLDSVCRESSKRMEWSMELDQLKQQVSMLSDRLDHSTLSRSSTQHVGSEENRPAVVGWLHEASPEPTPPPSPSPPRAMSQLPPPAPLTTRSLSGPSSRSSTPSRDPARSDREDRNCSAIDRVAEMDVGSPCGRVVRQEKLIWKLKKRVEDTTFRLRDAVRAREAADSRLEMYKRAAESVPKLEKDLESVTLSLERSEMIRKSQKERIRELEVELAAARGSKTVATKGKRGPDTPARAGMTSGKSISTRGRPEARKPAVSIAKSSKRRASSVGRASRK